MSLVRRFLASAQLGLPFALCLSCTSSAGVQDQASTRPEDPSSPAQTKDAALIEFCALLDELAAKMQIPRNPESFLQEFLPAPTTRAREWPRLHSWVAWGFDTNAVHGTRLRIGLRELRENQFHAHGTSVSSGPQRFVVLMPVDKWDRFVLLEEHGGKWRVALDEPIGKEPAFAGFEWHLALDEPTRNESGYIEVERPRLPAPNEGGWALSWAEIILGSGARRETTRTINWMVHSANGEGSDSRAGVLDHERGVDSASILLLNHDRWFDLHPLKEWPKPVWALSIELRSPWPLPTPQSPESNVWELADLLEGWKLPADTLEAQHVLAHGLRAPEAPAARDWPHEHGWLACGLRVRAPANQSMQLAFWDVRSRSPLQTQHLFFETTTALVFLLRVPELDRCALLRQDGTRWVFESGREIPEAARAGGFAALALPQLEHGGWMESGVHSVLAEERPRVRPRIENLWLWSGNGKGTLELAESKDGMERGVVLGSSVAGDATEFDPWFLQNPLQDWPFPVWSLRVELQ